MPWPLYLALKHLFPTGRWFSFFTLMSSVGVALGVALLLIVRSVMGGFGSEIRRMVVDTEGEVQIKGRAAIRDHEAVLERVRQVPGVAAATPTASGVLMVEHQGRPSFPAMRGLDLDSVESVVKISDYVRIGSLADLDDDSVILSSQLAHSLGVRLGNTIEVYSPLIIERLKSDEVFLPREVRVVGILEIGHQQLDSPTIYCTIRLAQDLYGLGSTVHGINVRLKPGENEDVVASRINAVLPPQLRAMSWMESFEEFMWVLQLEKNMIFFLLLFIVIVAGFCVASSLWTSVVRKTREIGVLSAIGGKTLQIASCFCFQGLIVGIIGTVAGLALGFGLLAVRNDIVLTLARLTQREEELQRFYQLSQMPSHTTLSDVLTIVVAAIIISTLAGLLPAWRAARLKPVEALRTE